MATPISRPIALMLLLVASAASATELRFNGSSGGALTPWVGTIEGAVRTPSYQEVGGQRTWVREGELRALPPVASENWLPELTRGRQAMYQLVKFCVDLLLAVDHPDQPTALGAITGNFYDARLRAANDFYGIVVECSAAATGGVVPRVEGTFTATVETPFPYCNNSYLTQITVEPAGAGAALLSGTVRLTLEDGTEMTLDLTGEYGFDPTVTLPTAYMATEAASYRIAEEPVQTLHVVETYAERLLDATPVPVIAAGTALTGVAPNPFNPQTTVSFTLAAPAPVDLAIFGLDGRRLATLARGERVAGDHRVTWDGRSGTGDTLPAGVYLCRLQAGGVVEARRVTLLK